MRKRILNLFAFVIAIVMISSAIPVSAADLELNTDWECKISDELLDVMSSKTDKDLIPIYIWLSNISNDIIDDAMIKEKGMDPAIFENEERFNKEIVPQIEAQIVSRVGYEAAYASVDSSEYVLDQNGAYHDDTISLVERAIQAKENEYILARRSIVKREHSNKINKFVSERVNDERNIIDIGTYVSRVIVEATISEIIEYAKQDDVTEITYYRSEPITNSITIPSNQVEAGYSGTKGSSYNNGNGYKGTGIKIGVIEAEGGRYRTSCPQLSGIPSSRLQYINNAGEDGASVAATYNDHATVVTSIIVGQATTVDGITYEGVVPLATVYQMPIQTPEDVSRAFSNLVDMGVTVINFSAGADFGTGYYSFDQDIDRLIYNTGVTFIVAAGNDSGGYGTGTTNVRSPGKALNAITVGNADTINASSFSSKTSPYYIHVSSSYREADYLPNKPDIVAPGTRIRIVKSLTASEKFYYDNGEESTGTSFAAPIVTGIVAQIQQAGVLGFSRWPALVKSVLATSADQTKIRTSTSSLSDSSNPTDGVNLWEKSGAGMVNAAKAVTLAKTGTKWNLSYFTDQGQEANSSEKYFTAGDHLRVTVVFEKITDTSISSNADFDDIDLRLIDPNGNAVASSVSSSDNLIIIDYTIPESGNYKFRISSYRFIHEKYDNLYYYHSWNVY